MSEVITEDHTPFGVGTDDFDGEAGHGMNDIARLGCCSRKAFHLVSVRRLMEWILAAERAYYSFSR